MSYATREDMVQRFSERELVMLTDRGDEPTGEVVDAVLDRALADADAEIDAYLGTRYSVPLAAPVPGIVVNIACNIARYRLADDSDTETETIVERYKAARRVLEAISSGQASLGIASPPTSSGAPQVSAPPRVFTRRTLGGSF